MFYFCRSFYKYFLKIPFQFELNCSSKCFQLYFFRYINKNYQNNFAKEQVNITCALRCLKSVRVNCVQNHFLSNQHHKNNNKTKSFNLFSSVGKCFSSARTKQMTLSKVKVRKWLRINSKNSEIKDLFFYQYRKNKSSCSKMIFKPFPNELEWLTSLNWSERFRI